MSFTALVLAGSRGGDDPLARHAGVSDKALIEFNGETMLTRVVAALREAGAGRIAVSFSSEAVADHARALGVETIPAAPGPSESVGRAFEALGAPLLVTTADHALLRPEWITRFVADVPGDVDVAALLAERRVIEAEVPDTRRTYLRFADGQWSGCNLFWLASDRAAHALTLWRSVEADRKRPWRIVRRLGPGLLLRYLFGRLTLDAALAALGRTAGVRAAAVASPFGLAAVDVDKPDDIALVARLIRARSPAI
ncbi:MAG: GTP--adenosylcobinamide-phosphate guanylyltransferase [Sphingomonas sp.]|nr:GTP--adenosylcobinamide-phosphate guanylyltransferase [Sphingomonas sp.]